LYYDARIHERLTRITGTLHVGVYLAKFVLEREMFQTKVVEKIKTHILYSLTFSLKPYFL